MRRQYHAVPMVVVPCIANQGDNGVKVPVKVCKSFSVHAGGVTLESLGKNVMVVPAAPQNDVLGHPTVQAVVTHGSNNSIHKAAYHAVPMVVVPCIPEQGANGIKVTVKICKNFSVHAAGVTLESLNLGKNVMVVPAAPQNDVLGLPSVQAFVTHGGNNSVYEAAYHAVPMVVVPCITEQGENAIKVTVEICTNFCMHKSGVSAYNQC